MPTQLKHMCETEPFEMHIIMVKFDFLNQAHAWFLEIDPVRMSVCVFVCVSTPEAINN